MEDIIKTCNLTVKLSTFTSNKKIYEDFKEFPFKLVWTTLERNLFLLLMGIAHPT